MKIPGYSIEGQIGQGGMAVVYRAIQESLGRPVALKIMNPLFAASPEFSERFLNEGRLLASLRHSHIMTIYDIGVSDGFHYISMEYVDGGDLRQQIRHGIPPETALDYVLTLGSCLKAAHEAHIAHRDVKPANILFRRDGTLLLTDFGIAKQLGNTKGLTVTGSVIGSPYYLSPEQALGSPIDGRADIYSLGIVLYEMLTGEKPFEGDSEIEIALKHIEGKLPRLPQNLSLFQPLLDKMTAKKPENRFSAAASMLQAVQHLRDTGRWNGAATAISPMGGENTVILEEQHQPAFVSVGVEQGPDDLHEGSRFLSKARNLVSGQRRKLAVVVGGLALAVGIIAGGLVGSKDKVIPTEATSSTQTQPEPQARLHAQVQPDSSAQPELQTQPDAQGRIDELLIAAHAALSDYRLTTPEQESAYYYYQRVLEIDAQNSQAMAGLSLIADRYLGLAKKALDKGQDNKARQYVKSGLRMQNDHPELLSLHDRLNRQEQQSDGEDESRSVMHWGEPRAARHSNGRDESRAAGNTGGSIDKFFRNVKRIFEQGTHQATGDNANNEPQGGGGD